MGFDEVGFLLSLFNNILAKDMTKQFFVGVLTSLN
jgi:hypothetical protein